MKNTLIPALSLVLALGCGGGASIPLETTPRTPAAVGTLDVDRGPNDNTVGKLHVEHLAPAQALRGDLSVYVAWVRPTGASNWQNVGQLLIGEDREGSVEVRVPHDQFELSVSAESDGSARNPSEFVVLRGQIDTRGGS